MGTLKVLFETEAYYLIAVGKLSWMLPNTDSSRAKELPLLVKRSFLHRLSDAKPEYCPIFLKFAVRVNGHSPSIERNQIILPIKIHVNRQ